MTSNINIQTVSDMYFDYIVVGGGSAGAVVASRLSEDENCTVLLLEAGRDYEDIQTMPKALLDANRPVLDGYNWHFKATIKNEGKVKALIHAGSTFLNASRQNQMRMARSSLPSAKHQSNTITSFDYAVGKVMGGSSAINGALALRGSAEDYQEWRNSFDKTLAGDWSQESINSRFNDIETNWIPHYQDSIGQLTTLQAAFREVCIEQGFATTNNHSEMAGVGCVSKNIKDGNRMSSALTYLSQARSNDNLTIIDQAKVLKLDWKQGKNVVKGVEVDVAGKVYTFYADHIVLCAGVINTPSLMMHSGIGDPQTLGSVNITPQVPLTGVGRNLVDHPVVALWGSPKQGVSHLDEPNHQVLLNYTSEGSSYRNDMNIYMLSGIDTTMIPILKTALGSSIGVALGVCLMKPHSSGRITLNSSSIASAPEITVNCLAETEDQRRMIQGVRIAWNIFKHRKLHSKLDHVLAWTDGVIQSDKAISHAISTFVRPSWHAVGTAKMGNNAEEGAVVNAKGKVFGVKNLWVADASIMPSIPRVPTYLSTVMIAETIVAGLRNHSS